MVSRARRRLFLLLLSFPLLVVVLALVYQWGMAELEHQPRTFWQAFEWSVETLTTTGYGKDASWHHPVMSVYVAAVQFLGVFLVFLIIPIYLIPFLEERFESRLPRQLSPNVHDHVLIFGYGTTVITLIEQLQAAGRPVVVIEEEESRARRLIDQGQTVVFRDLDDDALPAAGLERARALVANATDDRNANVILAARQAGFEGDILALVEEPRHRKPLHLAGANAVYTPRHMLGAALAARASRRLASPVAGVEALGEHLRVTEVRIRPESPLAGQTLAEADIARRTGVTVIGQWLRGHLDSQPGPDTILEAEGLLVVVGTEQYVEKLIELAAGSAFALRQKGHFIVGGGGEVGRKVAQLLRDAGEDVLLIDRKPGHEVDLVGDVLDSDVLHQAGIEEAQSFILALDSDSATLFATVILKDLCPQLPIIARVNKAQNVLRIHTAGAEFALSMSQVSGQILGRRLLGEDAVSIYPQLKVLRLPVGNLAGRRLGDLHLRARSGCSVVAVERGDEAKTNLDIDFVFEDGDSVFVCGSPKAVEDLRDDFEANVA